MPHDTTDIAAELRSAIGADGFICERLFDVTSNHKESDLNDAVASYSAHDHVRRSVDCSLWTGIVLLLLLLLKVGFLVAVRGS